LYDREGDGEFFQIYTHIFDERFFFEIVERPIIRDLAPRTPRTACGASRESAAQHPSFVSRIVRVIKGLSPWRGRLATK